MGVLLTSAGARYEDSYNAHGLMSVVAGTLDGGSMRHYSWWKLCDRYATQDAEGTPRSSPEQMRALLDEMEAAFVRLGQEPKWYFGYDSGAWLASYEKEQYVRKFTELLSFLRYAIQRNDPIVWSV